MAQNFTYDADGNLIEQSESADDIVPDVAFSDPFLNPQTAPEIS